jgi:hypothetical protein
MVPPNPKGRPSQVPSWAIPAGDSWLFPDSQGGLHNSFDQVIGENQRIESDQSRGASGGCGQDVNNVPPQGGGPNQQ